MNTNGVGFPDWSNKQNLLQQASEGQGTITENGWLVVCAYGTTSDLSSSGALQNEQIFLINGEKFLYGLGQRNNAEGSNGLSIPVKQGDTWSTTKPSSGSVVSYVVDFYPFLTV